MERYTLTGARLITGMSDMKISGDGYTFLTLETDKGDLDITIRPDGLSYLVKSLQSVLEASKPEGLDDLH